MQGVDHTQVSAMAIGQPNAGVPPREIPGGGINIATTYGPYLRLGGFSSVTRQWRGSVLIAAHSSRCGTAPVLVLKDGGQGGKVEGRLIDDWLGWAFWRFDLQLECGPSQRMVEYDISMPQGCQPTMVQGPHQIAIPSATQTWTVGYWSCNGFHEAWKQPETGGIQPLWRDIMAVHRKTPFHCMVGGGDQIYNDDVWECPAVKYWTEHGSHKTKLHAAFTPEMDAQVNDYYLKAYLYHWSEPVWRDALAVIPHAMVWDDHDIWDGWGSYPDYLQNCAVFQGIFAAARRAYLIFQQHSNIQTINTDNDVFGHAAWNWMTQLGPSTALLLTDSRTERSVKQIIQPASYQMMKERLQALPNTVKQLVVVTTVPVIYPQIPLFESSLTCLSCGFVLGRNRLSTVYFVQKTGLAKGLISQFGTVDILDDVQDHWEAHPHKSERKAFIHMMQDFALERGWRVSFVSGDVHLAAYGKFCTRGHTNPLTDHRFMPQLITSAIGNTPPGAKVVKALQKFSGMEKLDEHTDEGITTEVFGKKKLMPARNWLLQQQDQAGNLMCQYRVEVKGKPLVNMYNVTVPCLELPPQPIKGAAEMQAIAQAAAVTNQPLGMQVTAGADEALGMQTTAGPHQPAVLTQTTMQRVGMTAEPATVPVAMVK